MTYSSNFYRCPSCEKIYRGFVPKGGDGSAYIFPVHKNYTGARCVTSRTIIDEEKYFAFGHLDNYGRERMPA